MRRGLLIVTLILGIGCAGTAFAVDQSSANFQSRDSTFAPTVFDVASPNFSLNAAVEDIVTAVASNNFSAVDGVPLKEPPPSLPPPSGPSAPSGGGGAAYPDYLPPPTLQYRPYTFKSSQRIHGTRNAKTTAVWINGSDRTVTYPSDLEWQMELPLFLGANTVVAQGVGTNGARSTYTAGQPERILIGDVNRNHRVDDYDLSRFTRAWKKYSFFADFNEDGNVDDADLSLLTSHWLMFF